MTKEDFEKWITNNEWKISSEYEKSCQMQDLLQELEFRGYDTEQINEKIYKIRENLARERKKISEKLKDEKFSHHIEKILEAQL